MEQALESPAVEAQQDATQLVALVRESGLDETKSEFILRQFTPYFQMAASFERRAAALTVTAPDQTEKMKQAREARLYLRQKRVEVEHARKSLKEQSLREGRAIDGIANVLKGLLEPIEKHLEAQERYVEIQEAERQAALRADRGPKLAALGVDPTYYDLGKMPEEQFNTLLESTRVAREQAAERQRKEAEEQQRREEEERRIRAENERLRQEAAEREKKERAEREAREAAAAKQVREQQERERQIKAEAEEKIRKEREAREKLEREKREREAAEERERKRVEAEERKAKRAPDKAKLTAFIQKMRDAMSVHLPAVKFSEAASALMAATKAIDAALRVLAQEADGL